MDPPNRLLVAALGCWGVYFAQFYGTDDILWSPLFYASLLLSQLLPFAAIAGGVSNGGFKIPTSNNAAAIADATFDACCTGLGKALVFLLLLMPFFFNVASHVGRQHTVLSGYFMVLLDLVGYFLVALMTRFESCFGFLVCFLAGVVRTSYQGLQPKGNDHVVSKVFVCFLSVAMVFLCGMYMSLHKTNANTDDVETTTHDVECPRTTAAGANGGILEINGVV